MRKTSSEAVSASSSVMTITLPPFFRMAEIRKNSPVLKAMKDSATSGRKSVFRIKEGGIMFRQKGPIRIPATIYPVTLGSRSRLVTRVIRNPASSMTAMDTMTEEAVGPVSFCTQGNIPFLLPSDSFGIKSAQSSRIPVSPFTHRK